jgi:hypothetical protein
MFHYNDKTSSMGVCAIEPPLCGSGGAMSSEPRVPALESVHKRMPYQQAC